MSENGDDGDKIARRGIEPEPEPTTTNEDVSDLLERAREIEVGPFTYIQDEEPLQEGPSPDQIPDPEPAPNANPTIEEREQRIRDRVPGRESIGRGLYIGAAVLATAAVSFFGIRSCGDDGNGFGIGSAVGPVQGTPVPYDTTAISARPGWRTIDWETRDPYLVITDPVRGNACARLEFSQSKNGVSLRLWSPNDNGRYRCNTPPYMRIEEFFDVGGLTSSGIDGIVDVLRSSEGSANVQTVPWSPLPAWTNRSKMAPIRDDYTYADVERPDKSTVQVRYRANVTQAINNDPRFRNRGDIPVSLLDYVAKLDSIAARR